MGDVDCELPTCRSSALTATAVCEPLCRSIPVITAATNTGPFAVNPGERAVAGIPDSGPPGDAHASFEPRHDKSPNGPAPRYKARPHQQSAGGSGARPIRSSERYGSQPQRLPQFSTRWFTHRVLDRGHYRSQAVCGITGGVPSAGELCQHRRPRTHRCLAVGVHRPVLRELHGRRAWVPRPRSGRRHRDRPSGAAADRKACRRQGQWPPSALWPRRTGARLRGGTHTSTKFTSVLATQPSSCSQATNASTTRFSSPRMSK